MSQTPFDTTSGHPDRLMHRLFRCDHHFAPGKTDKLGKTREVILMVPSLLVRRMAITTSGGTVGKASPVLLLPSLRDENRPFLPPSRSLLHRDTVQGVLHPLPRLQRLLQRIGQVEP